MSFRAYSIPISLRNPEKVRKIQSLETYEDAIERSSKNRFKIEQVRLTHHSRVFL